MLEEKKSIEMGEGAGKKGVSPCVPEDIDMIAKSNKDALRVFAKKKFSINLDCGQHLNKIRLDLTKRVQVALGQIIDDPNIDEAIKMAIERRIPRYLLHPVNKRVFDASPYLLKRTDLIPCDKAGVPLAHFNEQEEVDEDDNDGSDELDRLTQDKQEEIDDDKNN